MAFSIDLNKITPSHLIGKWSVFSRSSSKPLANDHFSKIEVLSLSNDSFSCKNGTSITGKLTLARETKIIYNPQLKFFNNSQLIGNAIITRLTEDRIEGKEIHKLTLYFTTGLELVLQKN